jgi:hypothetical protein
MIPWIERPERHGTGPSRLSKEWPGKGLLNSEEREYQTEVTLEVIWFTAKSLIPVDRPKRPTAIYGISEFKFSPLNKSNVIAGPFKSAGALVQSTIGRRVVHIIFYCW